MVYDPKPFHLSGPGPVNIAASSSHAHSSGITTSHASVQGQKMLCSCLYKSRESFPETAWQNFHYILLIKTKSHAHLSNKLSTRGMGLDLDGSGLPESLGGKDGPQNRQRLPKYTRKKQHKGKEAKFLIRLKSKFLITLDFRVVIRWVI